MTRLIVPALIAAALVSLPACGDDSDDSAAEPPAWNHDPEDAVLGPMGWGALDESYDQCLSGTEQSPVDIATTGKAELLPGLEFSYAPTPLVVENTGHAIEVPMPEESENMLLIGDGAYRLTQYHFHAPSEHTLDGKPFDAEAHLVHENEDGRLAVVGVYLDRQLPPSELVDAAITSAPDEAGERVEVEEEQSIADELLSPEGSSGVADRYFTYTGSLTTPGCGQNVRWIVLEDARGISPASVERLHELVADFPGYDGYENNNRPTQPLNHREITRSGG